MDSQGERCGDLIRRYRLRAGLTQTGLALRLGRTQGWVSNVESGAVILDRIGLINDVAAALHIHPRDIMVSPSDTPGTPATPPHLARDVLTELRRYDLEPADGDASAAGYQGPGPAGRDAPRETVSAHAGCRQGAARA